MRHSGLFLFTAVCLAAAPAGREPATFDSVVKPFVARNCVMCHNAKMRSGELDLKLHTEKALEDRDVWESVVHKLRTGEMPPKGLPRPPQADVDGVAKFIEGEYERRDSSAKPNPGRVTARRLNKAEYNNTIRDLFGVKFSPADDFPADDSGYGFDNIGDVLSLSPVLMEKYLTAAEAVVRTAIVAERPQFRATRTLLKAEAVGMGEYLKNKPLPRGAAGPPQSRTALHIPFTAPAEGDYDVRISLGGTRPNKEAPLRLLFYVDGKEVRAWDFDLAANRPRLLEVRVHATKGPHLLSASLADHFDPAYHPPLKPIERYLTVDQFEVRGPYDPVVPPLPASHRKIVFCGHELNQHQPHCARQLTSTFLRRAYRRPATDAEVSRLVRLMEQAQRDGETFEGSLRVALSAALVSPHFLFRVEHDPAGAEPQPISEWELATRLSFFLWSSTPDDELLNLADRGQLRSNLPAQVRRMMADSRSSALAENFAGQWLQLRNLSEVKPDPDRFPDFDDDLRAAMKRETELFFDAVVREDRSLLDFIDGKYTFLNERLAAHYGILGVEGPHFRRVSLDGRQRSGVLTHASVLTVSSYPTRTSPVIRGKWVLENLLNAPPPPPPPDVPTLDEKAVGLTGSLRQQLEQHRSNSVCASCHSRMDPLGFGLENYDAIGAWRTRDGNFPIDVSGTLPNGKSFASPAELKTILKADKDEFVRCVVEKLLTYALGRGLERYDKRTVQSISRNLAARGYRFSALVNEITNSLPFQMRAGEAVEQTAVQETKAQRGTR